MRHPIAFLLVAASACAQSHVDPGLVGTWEVNVPNADGVARWVWEIHPDGTYAFHAEGPGDVPAHSGTFAAGNGRYTLRSTTIAWVDSGSYQLIGRDTLSATGKLGTGTWTRVTAMPVHVVTDSPATPPPDSGSLPPGGSAGVFTARDIYAALSHHPFDDSMLAAPLQVGRTEAVDPDQQDRGDGVVGTVRATITGSSSPATISFVVYRDRAAAEAARDENAVFDAKTFRNRPGEFVASHGYTYHDRGDASCLSRLMVHASSPATVTCYLLVQYPTREPVIIESQVSEQVDAQSQQASHAAIERADDLLFAGIKEWEAIYPAIGGDGAR